MNLTLEQQGLLDEAREHILSIGIDDASLVVSKINASVGLGKILYYLKKSGISSGKTFCLFTPDGGITRNKGRWMSGFSYGCLIRWPAPEDCGEQFIFPEIKPNACGMLVARIEKMISKEALYERLNILNQNGFEINNRKIILNLGISNHFIEVCRVKKSNINRINKDSYIILIHTSPSELKSELYDFEALKEKGAKLVETPLGSLLVIKGKQAEEYYQTFLEIDEFGRKKREMIARKICGDIELISNFTHQGLFARNEARLGLYKMSLDQENLYPMTFRWDIKNFLIKPVQNISNKNIKKFGLLKQIRNLEIDNIIENINVLPHGGGYSIPFPNKKWSLLHSNRRHFFRLNNGKIDYSFCLPSEVPYDYRGEEILNRSLQFSLGQVAVELEQLYTFRY